MIETPPRMNKIRSNIYLGNSQDANRVPALLAAGITAVLNVALDLEDRQNSNFLYFKEGLMDGGGNTFEQMLSAIDRLNKLVSLGHVVLVHCHVGMSRSAIVLAKYLSLKECRPLADCIQELQTLCPIVKNQELIDLVETISGPLSS